MIRRVGPTTTYVRNGRWEVKIFQRSTSGLQSIQVFPDSSRMWFVESWTYWGTKFQFTAKEIDSCATIADIRKLLKNRSRAQAGAV